MALELQVDILQCDDVIASDVGDIIVTQLVQCQWPSYSFG